MPYIVIKQLSHARITIEGKKIAELQPAELSGKSRKSRRYDI